MTRTESFEDGWTVDYSIDFHPIGGYSIVVTVEPPIQSKAKGRLSLAGHFLKISDARAAALELIENVAKPFIAEEEGDSHEQGTRSD